MLGDRRGGITSYLALATVPLMLSAGVAVDVSRAYHARARLSHALDAAGLAVGASLDSGATPQAVFDRFMNANYPNAAAALKGQSVVEVDGSVVRVSARIEMETSFMKLAGFDHLTIAAATEIVREESAMEVVLVLDNTGSMRGQKLETLRLAARELVDILFGDALVHDQLRVGVVPYAAAVNVGADAPNLVTQVGQGFFDPSNNTKWKGCVLARPYPNDVLDSPMNAGNKWKVYRYDSGVDNRWPPVVIRSFYPWRVRGPNVACPTPIAPLTGTKSKITAAIDAMEIWWGGTFSNLGMVWGWRVLSPERPFTQGRAYAEDDNTKAAILMTDGVNQFGKRIFYSPYRSDYTAYKYLDDRVLGTASYSGATAVLDSRLAEVCANMKAKGIVIYTITFALNNATTQNLYRQCASDSSKYFNSPSNEDLRTAFRAIGNDLRQLHISK